MSGHASHVVHPDVQSYLDFLNYLGCAASCCCMFSPMGSMFKIMRYGSSGKELMGLLIPYSLLFTQYFLWSFYGILTEHLCIAQINVLGSTMCLMYLAIMANYAPLKDRVVLRPMVSLCVTMLVLVSVSCIFSCEQPKRLKIFSYAGTFFACLLNIAPVVQSMEVIRTKSLEGFPVALTVAGFISSGVWSEYSRAIHDYGYMFPNLLGVVMNGFQICMVCWVYYKTMDMEDAEGSSMEPIVAYMKGIPSNMKGMNADSTYFKGLSAQYNVENMMNVFSGKAFKLGGASKAPSKTPFDSSSVYNHVKFDDMGRNHAML